MSGNIKQHEFIGDYNKIIPFLKSIFYYGTKSQSDLADEGICQKSKYAYLRKTLEYAFGENYEENKNINGQKAIRLRTDHFCDPHISFMKVFSLKSFTSAQRLLRICCILQKIYCDNGCTVNKLTEYFDTLTSSDMSSNIVRLLNDMCKYGLLYKSGSRFCLTDMKSIANCKNALILTDLYTNIYPLSICGSSILNKADINYISPFLIKHRHLGQIFNEELIWKLIQYIHEKQHISITSSNGIALRDLLPYRIITNRETGRQYVFVIYVGPENYNEYMLIRLDRIQNIKAEISKCYIPDEDILREKYDTAFRYSFNGTNVLDREKEPETGKLIYNTEYEWLIKRYFPYIEPEVVDETHCSAVIKVNSLIELKPWLRRNIGKVQLVESSDSTAEDFQNELKEWREMYGIE